MTSLKLTEVAQRWAPLAIGWLFMTLELVVATAVIARLAQPEVQLAAWGVVFAIATLIQAPATALLPVSTSLVRDRPSYRRLRVLTAVILAALTTLHLLASVAPLNDWLLTGVIGLPAGVAEAARWPLLLMLPWAFGTGYRRFLHGPIIRYGHGKVVIQGTLVRLAVGLSLLFFAPSMAARWGWAPPGAVLAAAAIIAGVLSELAFVMWRARTILPGHLTERAQTSPEALAVGRFAQLYAPLVMTTWLTMAVQLLVSVSLGRMPETMGSLAVWPVVFGFMVLWQGPGFAFTEVVIALIARARARVTLGRFAGWLALLLTLALALVAATPLAQAWFAGAMGLEGEPLALARVTLLLMLGVPALRMMASLHQGVLIAASRTTAVWYSVLAFALGVSAVLAVGVVDGFGSLPGAWVGSIAITVGMAAQAWVLWRAVRATPLAEMMEIEELR